MYYYPQRNPGEFVSMGATLFIAAVLTILAYFFIMVLDLNSPTLIIGENIFGFLMAMEPSKEEFVKIVKDPAKGWHSPLLYEEGGTASTGVFLVNQHQKGTCNFSIAKTSRIEENISRNIGDSTASPFFSPILHCDTKKTTSCELLTSTSVKISHKTEGNNAMYIYVNQLFPYILLQFNGIITINHTYDEDIQDYIIINLEILSESSTTHLVLKKDDGLIYHCKFDKDVSIKKSSEGIITIQTDTLTEAIILPVSFIPWLYLDKVTIDKIFSMRLSHYYRGCISNTNNGNHCIVTYLSEDKTGQLVFIPSLTMLHVGKIEHVEPIAGNNFWHANNNLGRIHISKQGIFSVKYTLLNLPEYDLRIPRRNQQFQFRLYELSKNDDTDLEQPNVATDNIHSYARKLYSYSNYIYIKRLNDSKYIPPNHLDKYLGDVVEKMRTVDIVTNGYIVLSYHILSKIYDVKFSDKYQLQILDIMKRISQPYEDDQYFNITQGFSPGKSYSEMMHSYYACYLVSKTWNDHKLAKYFRALLSIEIPTQRVLRFFGLRDGPVRNFIQKMITKGIPLDTAEIYPVASEITIIGSITNTSKNILDDVLATLLSPITPLTQLLIGKDYIDNLNSYIDSVIISEKTEYLPTTYPRYITFKTIMVKDSDALEYIMNQHLGSHATKEPIATNKISSFRDQTLPLEYSNSAIFTMILVS